MAHDTVQPTQPGSAPTADITTILPVPPMARLTPEQIRGADCVWCPTTLTAAAFPLGRRYGTHQGVAGYWFPRACDPCTREQARRVLDVHVRSCTVCVRRARDASARKCPDRKALRLLAGGDE
jgi:hypothetical protein